MSDGGERAANPKHPTGGCGTFPQRHCDHQLEAVPVAARVPCRLCTDKALDRKERAIIASRKVLTDYIERLQDEIRTLRKELR